MLPLKITYNLSLSEAQGLLSCKAVHLGEIPTFRRNIMPPYFGSKSKPRKKPAGGAKLS
jgi:hypothetical protein